jgi:metallo-beta-lactamase family protein
MEIQFLGAAQTVTGSQYLISVNRSRILLECGMFQGKRQESFERNRDLPFDAASVDALVLSHAHIDHSGNIPNLVRNGFQGAIYCTFATRDLCSVMLRDSAYIQERDVEYVNKKRARNGEPPVEPIYTHADAIASLEHFVSVGYGRRVPVSPEVQCTFFDAGHILGSAMVLLELTEGQRQTRMLFSGDLGRNNIPILRDPTPAPQADVLLIESTYGDRLHAPHEEAERRLLDLISATYAQGGKVIIPAFSVGRTQEIVYSLHRLASAHQLPDIPIYVDSPLTVGATEIFRLHPECYDEEVQEFVAGDHHPDPFGFERLRYIRNVEDSKALNDLKGSAVIISASGMCEAGRIQHHLKHNVSDPRNTILIVGWQSPYTLGRRLVERQETVKIFGQEYPLRARVETINGYSAHADQKGLLDWTRPIVHDLQHVFVIHGDPDPATTLGNELRRLGARNVAVPEQGDVFQI